MIVEVGFGGWCGPDVAVIRSRYPEMFRPDRAHGGACVQEGWALRSWIVLFGVALLAVTGSLRQPASARGESSNPAAVSPVASVRAESTARQSVDDLLELADQARASGDISRADALLRRAVSLDRRDPRAATTLRTLYQTPGISLPVDEEAVSEVVSQLGRGFRVTQTRHFVVISDCDVEWTRSREAMLERAYRQLFRFADRIGVGVYTPDSKLVCVLIDDYERYRAFAATHDAVSAHWMAGYYTTGGNRVVFYNDESNPQIAAAETLLVQYERDAQQARREVREAQRRRDERAVVAFGARADQLEAHVESERERLAGTAQALSMAKTIHEATHLVAFNVGLQLRSRQYPFWLTEGLATNFETESREGAFGPESEVGRREAELERVNEEGRLITLRQFVQLTEVPGESSELAETMYPQAYSLFGHAARYDRGALRGIIEDLNNEPAGEIEPARLLELFERHFGDVDAYERRWLRRLKQGQ